MKGEFDKLKNYAVGGAFSSVLMGGVEQTEIFVAEVNGKADPNALYTINIGGNDSYTVSSLGLDGATEKSAKMQAHAMEIII